MIKPLPEKVVIPRLSKPNLPGKMFFVDTETFAHVGAGSTIKHTLRVGHVIYWRRARKKVKEKVEEFAFDNVMDFWQWLDDRVKSRETVYLFAHNVTFDFLVLDGFRFLPLLDYKLKSIYSKFTTTIMRFANKFRRVIVADTMNYFPVSLDKLSKSVGVDKIKVDFENVEDERLRAHCAADAKIIYTAFRRMLEETVLKGVGTFKLTASGLSHSIYRRSFMNTKIVVNHEPRIVEHEKKSYIGGYTMVNQLVAQGAPDLFKLDVNSMYPSVMLDEFFPTKLMEFAHNVSVQDVARLVRSYSLVADVELNTDEACYPYRYKDAVCYPLGEFRATLSTPMLKRALDRGHVAKVYTVSAYKKAKIFSEFVSSMYAERLAARDNDDLARELFYKTIMNSLYGKFGQKRNEVKRVGDADINTFAVYDAFDAKTGEKWQEFHGGGSILFIYERGEARYTSYAIASHITEYARARLFDLMSLAGRENVLYLDTDSLFVTKEGLKRLSGEVDRYRLGALKVEEVAPFFIGLAKKDYFFGPTRKIKGFDASASVNTATVFKALHNVSFTGAARYDLRGGAFWREVFKRYDPYIQDVLIDKSGLVTPLLLPQHEDQLGIRSMTFNKAVSLSNKILTSSNKKHVASFTNNIHHAR